MKILIIGGNGFLGRHLLKRISKNNDVFVLSRKKNNNPHYIQGDIKNPLDHLPYFDIIINLVGLSPLKYTKPENYITTHIDGLRNIIEYADNNEIKKVIHISAYGANMYSKFEYISSKALAENLLINSTINYTIIRPSIIEAENSELFKILNIKYLPFLILPKIDHKIFINKVDLVVDKIIESLTINNKTIIDLNMGDSIEISTYIQDYAKKFNKKVLIAPISKKFLKIILNISGICKILPNNLYYFLNKNEDK